MATPFIVISIRFWCAPKRGDCLRRRSRHFRIHWRDTLWVQVADGPRVFLTENRLFAGTVVLHCHKLGHEDEGHVYTPLHPPHCRF
jgi:FtsP/CotA-like multicopper oxidase with cupredoxin domain